MVRVSSPVMVRAAWLCLLGCGLGLWAVGSPAAEPTAAEKTEVARTALEELNGLIGGWRGVAQPVRNSTKGAWTETADWTWDLKDENVAIKFGVTDGQQIQSATLTYDPASKVYQLTAVFPEKVERTYRGKRNENKLILESPADAGFVHRLTLTELNEKRTLLLLEKRPADGDRFVRVVEVGYTRQGTSLAVEGAGEPECIVSGGKGTMTVAYKGKTYYVCCTGCRDAFLEDPEGILADAAERAAKKKAKVQKVK